MTLNELIEEKSIPRIGFGPGLGFTHYPQMPNGLKNRMIKKFQRKFCPEKLHEEKERFKRNAYIESISNAINVGFRFIDYSASYGDGKLMGEGIKRSNVSREELIITTRVSNRAQYNHCVYEEILEQIQNLQVGYIDILQFHWPVTDLYLQTWKEMERLVEDGIVKHLGVANCHKHHIESILNLCKYSPEIGQFEIHPLFSQKPLIQYYQKNNIIVEAYTPIARYDDRLVRLPLLKKLEDKYKKSFIQIILRWHLQNNCIPLTRCMTKEHQVENINIFDFTIDNEDMKLIDSININSRLRFDPDNCDFSIL